jgi:hypothetical protein
MAGGDSEHLHFKILLFVSFFYSLFSLDQKSRAPLPSKQRQRRQYDTALQLKTSPHRLWMCDQAICAQRAQATI